MKHQNPSRKYCGILLENCNDMQAHINDLQDDLEFCLDELRYLHAFISYKDLGDEYKYFKENAREVYAEDMPFPTLTL